MEDFVSLAKKVFSFVGTPMFVDCSLDGGAYFGGCNCDSDVFIWEHWVDEVAVSNCINEAHF